MKRSLVIIYVITLFLAYATRTALAQNDTNHDAVTVAKSDTDATAPMAKMDAAMKTDGSANVLPMVKMDPKTEAAMKAGIAPSPDGNDLAMSCKADVEGFDAGYCLGVVEGVIASMRVCKHDHSVITLGEAADATAKYIASHPEQLKLRDVVLARKALSKAYPCGPSRK